MSWFAGCCGGRFGKSDPTLREQIAYAAKAVGRILDEGFEIVDKEERNRRAGICSKCEYEGVYKCKICNCLLILKRPLATESCPEERW